MARGSLHKHTLHKSNKLLRAQIEKPTLDFLSNVAWKVQKEWQNIGVRLLLRTLWEECIDMNGQDGCEWTIGGNILWYWVGVSTQAQNWRTNNQMQISKSANQQQVYYANVNRLEKAVQHKSHEYMVIQFFGRRSLLSSSNVNPNLSWFFVSL